MAKQSWMEYTISLTEGEVRQYRCQGRTNAVMITNPDNDTLVFVGFTDNVTISRYDKMVKNNSTALLLKLFEFNAIYLLAEGGDTQVKITEIFSEDPLELIQNVLQDSVYYQEMPLLKKSENSGIYTVLSTEETIIDCTGFKKIELINRGGGVVFFDIDRVADGNRPNLMLIVDEYRGMLVRCNKLHMIAQDNPVSVEVVLWR